jgi:hypothetical protein
LIMLRHVFGLPQQVPWTGQQRRTMGLERLGFYGDTWAAQQAGLRIALRAGLRADRATRRAALRTGHRAAGRAARRTDYRVTAPLDLRTNGRRTPKHTNGHRGPASALGVYSRIVRWDYARGSDSVYWGTHRSTGQLGPRHPPAPARTCSHT